MNCTFCSKLLQLFQLVTLNFIGTILWVNKAALFFDGRRKYLSITFPAVVIALAIVEVNFLKFITF